MVGLLCLAHDEGCEGELAELIAQGLPAGHLPDAWNLKQKLAPIRRELPEDNPVNLTGLASFDDLLAGQA